MIVLCKQMFQLNRYCTNGFRHWSWLLQCQARHHLPGQARIQSILSSWNSGKQAKEIPFNYIKNRDQGDWAPAPKPSPWIDIFNLGLSPSSSSNTAWKTAQRLVHVHISTNRPARHYLNIVECTVKPQTNKQTIYDENARNDVEIFILNLRQKVRTSHSLRVWWNRIF